MAARASSSDLPSFSPELHQASAGVKSFRLPNVVQDASAGLRMRWEVITPPLVPGLKLILD